MRLAFVLLLSSMAMQILEKDEDLAPEGGNATRWGVAVAGHKNARCGTTLESGKLIPCYVSDVEKGGTADKLGLLRGDEIVSVRTIGGHGDVPATYDRLKQGPGKWEIPKHGVKSMHTTKDFANWWQITSAFEHTAKTGNEMAIGILTDQFAARGLFDALQQLSSSCVKPMTASKLLPQMVFLCLQSSCSCDTPSIKEKHGAGVTTLLEYAMKHDLLLHKVLTIPQVVGVKEVFEFWSELCHIDAMVPSRYGDVDRYIDYDAILGSILENRILKADLDEAVEPIELLRKRVRCGSVPDACKKPEERGRRDSVVRTRPSERCTELPNYAEKYMPRLARVLLSKPIDTVTVVSKPADGAQVHALI